MAPERVSAVGFGRRRRHHGAGWWALLLSLAPRAGQSAGEPLPAMAEVEGLPLRTVRILAPPDASLPELERLSGLVLGEPLTGRALRAAVERLYGMDEFRSVVARVERAAGGAAVELVLEPRRRLVSVRVSSSGDVPTSWIRQALAVEPGRWIDERDLPEIEARLEAALERRGWRSAVSRVELSVLDGTGRAELVARVEPGPPTRLGRIRVRGRLPIPTWRLDVGLRPGDILDLERVTPALEALAATLRADGHIDARVPPPSVLPIEARGDTPPSADLRVEVDAGPRVEVRFEGNLRIPRRKLEEDARILRELGSGPAGLLEVEERLRARYERIGHPRARIDVHARTSPDGQRRQVLFRIEEGPGTRVVALRFPGARALEPEALRAQVHETVARFLQPTLGEAGVDPEVVDRMVRGEASNAPRRQPSTAAPDPQAVYVPRAYRAAAETIADLYRSAGYQTVEVGEPEVRARGAELLDVSYPIREGLRWRIGSVAFSGHRGVAGAELLAALGVVLEPGREPPLAFETVDDGRRAILALYRNRGYIFASVEEELREVPRRGGMGGRFQSPRGDLREVCAAAERAGRLTCDVEVGFRINEGPQVIIRDVVVRGLDETRISVVEGEVRLRPGQVLSEAAMVATRDNLVRLGVFERVVVRPAEPDRPSSEKDVLIELAERDNLSLDLGAGASTEEGVRVFGGFANRNLFGTALRFQTNAKVNLWIEPLLSLYDDRIRGLIRSFYEPFGVAGPSPLLLLEYEVAAGLSYPRIFLLPPGFSFGLDVIVLGDYDPAFAEESQRLTLIANYEGFKPRLFGRRRPVALQVRTTLERSELECNDAVEGREDLCSSGVAEGNLGNRTEGQNAYLSVVPRIGWDFRDTPLDPNEGVYLELEGELAAGLDAQSPGYVRLEGRASAYAPVAPRLTFATALRGGRIFPTGDVEIPVNRRFFAGGRSTIRGYPEKTLLPQDVALGADGEPTSDISTGGLLYLALKTELRVLVASPVSLAGFFDIGDLWRLTRGDGVCGRADFGLQTACTLPDGRTIRRRLVQGAGFGVRVATPIGPLTVDLGFPLNRRDRAVDDWTLHFSVGPF